MSEAKHTPGPWKADNAGGHGAWYIHGPTGRLIARAIGDSAEAEANASLIVAAPELLEALKRVAYEDDRKRGFDFVIHQTVMAQVKAAIAKAEGRDA